MITLIPYRFLKPLLFLMLIIQAFFIPTEMMAQDDNNEVAVSYKRPEHKVYKSISAALLQPDSVFILELKGKKLTTVPEEVYRFPNLLVLDLSKNKITELPADISKLKSLEELNLASNKIKSLPSGIGDLKGLKMLSLNRNLITELPASIGNMSSLQVLELWDTELSTLPDEIRNLSNLRTVELRGVLFTDEQQKHFREMLPGVRLYMSPACDCKVN
jgi:Leucine-rich repeat (LRR) protein